MNTYRKRFPDQAVLCIVLVTACGCPAAPDTTSATASKPSTLLTPFAGRWTCDLEKTLAARLAAGAAKDEVDQLRQIHQVSSAGGLHPDVTFSGDTAVYAHFNILESEYLFFGLHRHDNTVCGKAWHHEDRHDPGDMSKCYVRLAVKEGDLWMDVRMKESLDLDDPDLLATPATEDGSADDCQADKPDGSDWSAWETYVFTRRP